MKSNRSGVLTRRRSDFYCFFVNVAFYGIGCAFFRGYYMESLARNLSISGE